MKTYRERCSVFKTLDEFKKEDPMKYCAAAIVLLLSFAQVVYGVERKVDYEEYLQNIDPKTVSPLVERDNEGKEWLVTGKWYAFSTLSPISIGPGIQALSIGFDGGKIGLLNSFSPLVITFNLFQSTYVTWHHVDDGWARDVYRGSFWSPSLGITFGKDQETDQFILGLSLVALQLSVNEFGIGIGVEWRNRGVVDFGKLANYSVIVQITYKFDLGK